MATAVRKTNWFAIWISVAVVAVLIAVGAIVVVTNNAASGPGEAPQASNIDTTTGAISFGTGTDTVSTYIDFMCPYCSRFEQTEGETISQLIADGTITLKLQPVAMLDRSSQGTKYSSRSAAAMYAVAERDPDNAYAFMQAMYQNQPQEGSTGLTDEQIIDIARQAGVNVTSDLESDITSGKYIKFAQAQKLPDGATGTPTVMVNDKIVRVTYDPQTDIVANLSK